VSPILEELTGVPSKVLLHKTTAEVGMCEKSVPLWEAPL
jgi:hypothetical protein